MRLEFCPFNPGFMQSSTVIFFPFHYSYRLFGEQRQQQYVLDTYYTLISLINMPILSKFMAKLILDFLSNGEEARFEFGSQSFTFIRVIRVRFLLAFRPFPFTHLESRKTCFYALHLATRATLISSPCSTLKSEN